MTQFSISGRVRELARQAETDIAPVLAGIDRLSEANTQKVLASFISNRVTESSLVGTTGYGYGDTGRGTLDRIYAEVFGCESALVRIGFVNGTHAISAALFACVPVGGSLLSVTGKPYDTLCGVIGICGDYYGSLKSSGVSYDCIELQADGKLDYAAIGFAVAKKKPDAVFVQRSRGYSSRPALTVSEIGKICEIVHAECCETKVIVDNCYGEFTESREPVAVGADLMAGSLIKNPGGGLAPTGGYVAGKRVLVENAASRLTCPGIGGECGSTLGTNRLLHQGFFLAPHVVAQALKTAVFSARLFELLGYVTSPCYNEARSDIIQVLELGTAERLELFCRGIQSASPIDSFVVPEAWEMPGYDCKVIMAAGAFNQGASIELSCDGPMREPYAAFLQGGLTYESGKLSIMIAADMLNTP